MKELKRKIKPTLILPLTLAGLLITSTTSVYGFDFNQCQGMQGNWVNNALASASSLKGALNELKAIKECSPLKDALESLQMVEPIERTTPEQQQKLVKDLSKPDDLRALTELNKEIGNQGSDNVNRLQSASIMSKTISSSTITSEGKNISRNLVQNSGKIVDALTSKSGVECLNTSGAPVAEIIGSTLGIVTSYAFSNYGLNVQMGSTINKIVNLLKGSKIQNAISAQQTVIFWTQLSCLIESTTDNYCGILTAKQFMAEEFKSIDYYNKTLNQVNVAKPYTPLDSYLVMNQDIPKISNWIDYLMRGVDPISPQDAASKNAVISSMSVFTEKFQNVLGYINETKKEFKLLCDGLQGSTACKKTRLLKMVENIVRTLMGESTFFSGDERRKNFYAVKFSSSAQYAFALFGMEVPPPVAGLNQDYVDACNNKYLSQRVYTYQEYLYSGKDGFNCIFNDPDNMMDIISSNAQKINDEIALIAYDYFDKYIVVDKPKLFATLHTSTGFTIYESFKNVKNYLIKVQRKLLEDQKSLRAETFQSEKTKSLLNGINILVATIDDTLKRVDAVVQAMDNIGDDNYEGSSEQRLGKVTETLAVFYDQLNVGMQKNGFLQGRLATIVDFETRLMLRLPREKVNQQLSQWVLFGQNTLVKMMNGEMGGVQISPNERQNDIDTALMIADSNLSALEAATKNLILGALYTADKVSKGTYPEGMSNWNSFVTMLDDNHPMKVATRRYVDAQQSGDKNKIAKAKKNWDKEMKWYLYGGGVVNSGIYNLRSMFWTVVDTVKNSDKKPTASSNVNLQEYTNTGAFSRFMDKLCIQSLVYKTSRAEFNQYCKGRKLTNDYVEHILHSEALKSKLSISYDDITKRVGNGEERVCAYNRYKMRNKGYQILLVLNKEIGDFSEMDSSKAAVR